MDTQTKKPYTKPTLIQHGSVEEVTGWLGGGSGEFIGGVRGHISAKPFRPAKGHIDFGS